MQARLVAVLALILGSALTGCLATPDFLQATDKETTALAGLGAADEAAKAWNADAKLAGVGTIETQEHPSEADLDGDGSSEDDVPQDPDVGNGLARVWWYAYTVETAEDAPQVRAWRVAADGTVERQDDHGFGSELGASGLAIAGWETDSDEAIEVAKTNGTFLNSIAGENATVVHILVNEEGVTLWRIVGVSRAGFAIATVDAASGDLVDVRSMSLGRFTVPDTEGFTPYVPEELAPYVDMTEEGTIAPGESAEYPFEVPGDAVGMIHFAAEGRIPTDNAWWAILDDDGDVVAEGYGRSGFWSDRESEDDLELEAGAYVLKIGSSGWAPMGPVEVSEIDYAVRLFLGPPGLEMHEDEEEG